MADGWRRRQMHQTMLGVLLSLPFLTANSGRTRSAVRVTEQFVRDTSVHHPTGLLQQPISLSIKDGRVMKIEGGIEAQQLIKFIEENSCGKNDEFDIELSIGFNPKSPLTGMLRTDQKTLRENTYCHRGRPQRTVTCRRRDTQSHYFDKWRTGCRKWNN